jgi:serine/threonine protein phosphatase PrpC
LSIIYCGHTDIGMKRKTNQDSICLSPENNFFAVADGMGGHNGGDIASQMSVKLLPEFLVENKNLPTPERVGQAIKTVNRSIYDHAAENPELKGMGTTITSIAIEGGELHLGNVGDSRTYLISRQKLYQLSKDHSLVQEKLNVGIYDREQAKNDPQKNVLIRTVGYEQDVDVDLYKYKIQYNDLFLLCSDGLSGKVHDQDIIQIVNTNIPDPLQATKDDLDRTAKQLIDQANANGGQDNISVILVLVQGVKTES